MATFTAGYDWESGEQGGLNDPGRTFVLAFVELRRLDVEDYQAAVHGTAHDANVDLLPSEPVSQFGIVWHMLLERSPGRASTSRRFVVDPRQQVARWLFRAADDRYHAEPVGNVATSSGEHVEELKPVIWNLLQFYCYDISPYDRCDVDCVEFLHLCRYW